MKLYSLTAQGDGKKLQLPGILHILLWMNEQKTLDIYDWFGSYAKGKETPTSDVDLLVSGELKGLKFYGLVEELRVALCKKVDVLEINQLKDNLELTEEILKEGLKIYG